MTALRYRRRTDVAVAESAQRAVVLALSELDAATLPIALNDTAYLIWSLAEDRTAEQISAALAESLSIPASEIDGDVSAFLTELVNRRVLQTVPDTP